MMKPSNILLGAILLASMAAATVQGQTRTTSSAAQLKTAQSALAGITPTFIENRGQWNREARFLSRFNGLDLWVTDHSIVYDIYGIQHGVAASASGARRVGNVVRMNFLGTTSGTAVQTGTPHSGTYNYFYGKDPSQWTTGVHSYDQASIQNIYKGIDAVVYVDGGMPRYDIVVAPGADPSAIRVNYDGATGVRVDRGGDLVLSTTMGDIRQQQLFAYQLVDGAKRKVTCSFSVKGNGTVGFNLGGYDAARPLVIDPLIYSSYLGGSGNDEAKGVGTDTTGQIYVAGNTVSTDFPVKAGSYQTINGGNQDVFVMRLNTTLTPSNQVIYATYIGGPNDDAAFDIAVDDFRNAYVAGTADASFPTISSIMSVTGRGTFAVKLSADGTALLYSTFVCDGATFNEGSLALDSRRQLYITGTTNTNTLATTIGAYQTSLNGRSNDAFVAVLNLNGNGYRYATYLGGSGDDIATGIVRDANYIYVTGRTTSIDFPLSAAQAYDASYNGGTDVFVARLDTLLAGAAQLSYSTYIGGSDYDGAEGIGVDNIGRIYVAGATSSANFPTRNALQPVYGGKAAAATLGDAFVTKLDPAVLPAVQLQYSTFIGGALSDAVTGLVVDGNGNSFLTGWTASSTYPTTLNAVDTSFGGDSSDVFITKLSPVGKIIYSTFLGGTGGDKANAISIDNKNNIYVAGSTISTNYPVTNAGVFRTITGSGNTDAFVTKLSILQVLFPNGGDTLCAGVNNVITWTGGTSTNYDIYQSSNGGQTFNPLALNVVGNSYTWSTPALFPAGNKYRIKVMTSNGPENDVSDSNFVINTPPRVTQQPNDITQPSGGTAIFSVVFAGTPAPAVQWQVDKGAGYTNVAGATSSTLTLNNVQPSQNGWRYRAILTNSCSSISSNPGTLTVFAVLVTAPNGNEQYCAGSQHAITWTSVSTTGPFDLYLMDENSGALTTIATGVTGNSDNWTIPGNLFGTQYRIQIRLATAQTGDQSDTTFTIKRTPVFVAQPLNQTALKGNSASFTVSFNETPAPT
ncbi:MAG: SBBP repeat-containing protein, partial [Candidatus Kapaibacterium sp.]